MAGPAQVTGSWRLWGSEWAGVKHPWEFKHPTEPAGQGEGEPGEMGVCWHGALPAVAPLRGDVAESRAGRQGGHGLARRPELRSLRPRAQSAHCPGTGALDVAPAVAPWPFGSQIAFQ